jgi:hypothetical protein
MMGFARYSTCLLRAMRSYLRDMRASLSLELVFAIPLLIWAYLGMTIFQDAFRAKMEGEAAALHVADLISRNTNEITVAYLEGMNDVFDFLTTRGRETRLRISSVMLNTETGEPRIVWSYGTRGLAPLSTTSSTTGTEDGDTGFGSAENQAPIEQLQRRIPTILPGEALILVETFALWNSPLKSLMGLPYLDDVRLTPLAVTRPRFSPFIRFELDNDVFPETPLETVPPVGEPEAPTEPEEPPAPVPDSPFVTVVNTNFSDGDLTNWTNGRITTTGNGSFLGPFANETRNNPVTFRSQSPHLLMTMRIEFDLLVIGTWDGFWEYWARPEGEFLMIQINGESISLDPFQVDRAPLFMNSRNTTAFRAEGQFHTQMTNIWNTDSAPEHNGQSLQVWKVEISVFSPASDMAIGFSANVDGDIHDESFGIRDFRITGARMPSGVLQPQTPRPDPATFVGRDPFTEFPLHDGCPKVLSSAPTYTMFQSNLRSLDIWFQVRARGTRDLRTCPNFSSTHMGFAHEAPTVVLNWVHIGGTRIGGRLQIETEDGNRGRSCDTALLILDAFGQWHYQRNRTSLNRNARLRLGVAGTGPHYIWVLRESAADCNVDIEFSLY